MIKIIKNNSKKGDISMEIEIENEDEFKPEFTNINIDNLLTKLNEFITSIKNNYLQKLLKEIIYDPKIIERLKFVPSAIINHHKWLYNTNQ
jgi:hypothetical protein